MDIKSLNLESLFSISVIDQSISKDMNLIIWANTNEYSFISFEDQVSNQRNAPFKWDKWRAGKIALLCPY